MPRNAQWTAQEDQELTKLTLTNSKENNGNLDWDEIHDLRSGQIARRSKNAMISRWWKIKEQHSFDIDDNEDDEEEEEEDDDDDEDESQDINNSDTECTEKATINSTVATIEREDLHMRKRRKRRHKKRKKEKDHNANGSNNCTSNGANDPMQNIIHSILRKKDCKKSKYSSYNMEESATDLESEADEDHHHHHMTATQSDDTLSENIISYKNYYKHDIETLKLTSFDICQLKPYIRAFEQQVLMVSPETNNDANMAEIKKENANLRKTIILQNKFLNELYTKIQHQQGIVREMVECCEKLKFKMKCMEDIMSKQVMDKNKEITELRGNMRNLEHKLNTTQLLQNINNISGYNDLNVMMHFINNLSQILECNRDKTSSDTIHEMKCKLFAILNKTEYAKNMNGNAAINGCKVNKKRKRNHNEFESNNNQLGACAQIAVPSRKKRKQLSLPTINGNNTNNASNIQNLQTATVQPVLFTPSMTAEYQRILPPSLSAHVPPPLPQTQHAQHAQQQTHHMSSQKNKYGIDLLLKVAMLDHQNK